MEDASGTQDGADTAEPTRDSLPRIVDIAPQGDVVLDVTFETSKQTLNSTRKATQPRPGQRSPPPRPVLKPKIRLAYRVELKTLTESSQYFNNLLKDTRFAEAREVTAAFKAISLRDEKPAELDAKDLPRVSIVDDDEATRAANREVVFGDLLRILHGKDVTTKSASMIYVTTLAVLADRFICISPVSRALGTILKFKWPATQARAGREDAPHLTLAAEETLRQKILVAWLLKLPARFHAATRELIIYGSYRWKAFAEEEEDSPKATWWDLQDDIEAELQYRRECILNTIASVQRHFLRLYASRERQCKLGYDSSAACDSYQLGEMVKFLMNKNLLFPVDFSPRSLDSVGDYGAMDIGHVLSTMKQCPSYQIDKNHTNCGLRTRIMPIMYYIESMLSSNVIGVSHLAWNRDRASATWIPDQEQDERNGEQEGIVFRFTRSISGDQRLRFEGAMATDRMARGLFTASNWDWTPED